MPAPRPHPRRAARLELVRALLGVAGLPLRLGWFALTRRRWKRRLAVHLNDPAPVLEAPPLPAHVSFPDRPLRFCLSCGEASSAGHAARVAEALRAVCREAGAPPPELFGLGPAALSEAGVDCIADPTAAATMGGQGVFKEIPFYLDVLEAAAQAFADQRPDAFVPVDAPALHVPLARIARRYGVPTVHMVAPQYWAWGPWRAAAYRKVVARALTIFAWEPGWFADRAVPTAHVGHPQLDVLQTVEVTAPEAESRCELVLLPGSRRGEVSVHLPWMLRAAAPLAHEVPGFKITVAQSGAELRPLIESILEHSEVQATLEVGDLHATLSRARSALAASGTVLTDLLHHRLPAVVIYALRGGLRSRLVPTLLTTPFFSTTNLLAGEELLPERGFRANAEGPLEEVSTLLRRAHLDAEWRAECQAGLQRAAERLGPAGAARRCAQHVLEVALGSTQPL